MWADYLFLYIFERLIDANYKKHDIMKKKFYLLALLLVTALSFTACDDDDEKYPPPPITNIVGSRTLTSSFMIEPRDWYWNSNIGRYECSVKLKELTEYIYDNGSINFSVFTNPKTPKEIQHELPFINTFLIDKGNGHFETYTETIKADCFKNGNINFYIQSSDLGREDSVLETLEFKVVLNWTEPNE